MQCLILETPIQHGHVCPILHIQSDKVEKELFQMR